jgi:sterol desaturase/sphingolipid hydroxylase (fatty acid hydroxylase superfamily)
MEQYFSTIPSSHRALILALGITFFWLLEGGIPLKKFVYGKWKHASLNFFFTFTTILINFLFAKLIVQASDWCQANHFGIYHTINTNFLSRVSPFSSLVSCLSSLLLLDLISAYLIHWIEHKIKWMWRFHMIHHSDTYVDTTTANRHHPGESVFRAIFTLLAVYVIGAPIWLVMMYQSISVVLSQFNHANISLPEKVDKAISWIIVSPNMHKIHHHYMQPETDSNYGNIFSIWDRLFGTYREMDLSKLKYGLDILPDEEAENWGKQLRRPFS